MKNEDGRCWKEQTHKTRPGRSKKIVGWDKEEQAEKEGKMEKWMKTWVERENFFKKNLSKVCSAALVIKKPRKLRSLSPNCSVSQTRGPSVAWSHQSQQSSPLISDSSDSSSAGEDRGIDPSFQHREHLWFSDSWFVHINTGGTPTTEDLFTYFWPTGSFCIDGGTLHLHLINHHRAEAMKWVVQQEGTQRTREQTKVGEDGRRVSKITHFYS